MKTLLCFVIFLTPCIVSADWTRADTIRQSAVTVTIALDWAQTRYIAKHPDQYYEKVNKILDSQPSVGSVNRYFLLATAAHYGISRYGIPLIMPAIRYLLPSATESDIRAGWQYVSIGFEAGMVARNYNLGIKFYF